MVAPGFHPDLEFTTIFLDLYLSRTGLDCSIHVWSLSNLSFVTKLEKAHDKAICSMAANHNFLFTGSLNIIKVWQLDADKGESALSVNIRS